VAKETVQTNRYTSPFVLDGAKLTRILTVLEGRFTSAGAAFNPAFRVTLRNGKNLRVAALSALLALDNTLKNPVSSLEIVASTDQLGAAVTFDDTERNNIVVAVRGADPKVVGELFAEVEEQVERAMVRGWVPKLLGGAWSITELLLPLVLVGGLVAAAGTFIFSGSERLTVGLTKAAADEARRGLTGIRTVEDKINWLFEVERKKIELSATESEMDLAKFATWPNFFLALPILIAVGCVIYMARTCYPRAVFVWGDWDEHYGNIVSKRRAVWGLIVLALVVGIVSSLFVTSFQRFVPPR